MPVVVDGELKSVGRWCQGEVLRAYEGRNQLTVRVLWDPMPYVRGYEEAREGDQVLLPTKWKKDKDNSWIMDVDVNIATTSTREDMNVEKLCKLEARVTTRVKVKLTMKVNLNLKIVKVTKTANGHDT